MAQPVVHPAAAGAAGAVGAESPDGDAEGPNGDAEVCVALLAAVAPSCGHQPDPVMAHSAVRDTWRPGPAGGRGQLAAFHVSTS